MALKLSSLIAASLMLALLLVPLGATDAQSSGDLEGEGTPADPYLIGSASQLDDVRNNLSAHYRLVNDIDLSGHGLWTPIGLGSEFVGVIEGDGHSISGLRVNLNAEGIGLFSAIGASGRAANLSLLSAQVVGIDSVGALAGISNGTIENLSFNGEVSALGDRVGGVVGLAGAPSLIERSHSSGTVSGYGLVGGMVGENRGSISNSSSSAAVSGAGVGTGGLVGYNNGSVQNCSSAASVEGVESSGGLVGLNNGSIIGSEASGDAEGVRRTGGLVGENQGEIEGSASSAKASGKFSVGGLAGHNLGSIRNCSSSGDVEGTMGHLGGLTGSNAGEVFNSHYNISAVSINGAKQLTLGGLFERQYHDWRANNMTLDVDDYFAREGGAHLIEDVQGMRDLLGFAHDPGLSFRLLHNLEMEQGLYIPYVAAQFDGGGCVISGLDVEQPLSGSLALFGQARGAVERLDLREAKVKGYMDVGGLVGLAYNGSSINNVSVAGEFSGHSNVGAVIGRSIDGSALSKAHASGELSAHRAGGGLLGHNEGSVAESYANVSVTGTTSLGALIGDNQGTAASSYWNNETSVAQQGAGAGDGSGMEGLNSSDMRKETSFVGWDFIATWAIDEGNSTPLLQHSLWPKLSAIPDQAIRELDSFLFSVKADAEAEWAIEGAHFLEIDGKGTIIGRPQADDAGDYQVNVTATDRLGNEGREQFNLTVTKAWAPSFESSPLNEGQETAAYSYVAVANESVVWSWEASPGAGFLSLAVVNGSLNISGVPSPGAAGSYWVNITATSVEGNLNETQTIDLSILPATAIVSEAPATAAAGAPYQHQAEANVEVAAQGWWLSSDAPFPVAVDDDGLLTASPGMEHVGDYYVHLRAESLHGVIGGQNYTLTVSDMVRVSGAVLDSDGMPVAGADVLVDGVKKAVTNETGRYVFSVQAGEYTLTADKPGMYFKKLDLNAVPGVEAEMDPIEEDQLARGMLFAGFMAAALALVGGGLWALRRRP